MPGIVHHVILYRLAPASVAEATALDAVYQLAEPVKVEPGQVLRVACRHDASLRRGEPRYVLWGEGTTDEMCLGALQVTP